MEEAKQLLMDENYNHLIHINICYLRILKTLEQYVKSTTLGLEEGKKRI